MADTKIEWADQVWNPVVGCSLESPGCTNCYAMKMANRLQAMAEAGNAALDHYRGTTQQVKGKAVWTGKLGFSEAALLAPLRRKKATRYFVNSMSDLFHEHVSDAFIAEVWRVMRATPWHSYQILTKRPERMAELLAQTDWDVLPNVWLGTSVEDAAVAHRIDHLRRVPAAIRFISFEPLIGPVGDIDLTNIHWAIVGGESGPNARPMDTDWARSLRDQCAAARVAFFFKQHGEWIGVDTLTAEQREDAGDLNLLRADPLTGSVWLGKKAAGHLLDGIEHNQFPATGEEGAAVDEQRGSGQLREDS